MPTLPRLIGLIGRKGAGKDTAAETLTARGYRNEKFAGGLKEMLRYLLLYQGADAKTIERMIEGDLKEVPTDYLAGRTPRHAMQTLGTEWGRDQMDSDLWVRTAVRRASGSDATVITDVRFPNERDAILNAGGAVYGIVADWIKPTEGEHESEAKIDAMIAELPASSVVLNKRAAPGQEDQAIQEFQVRFLTLINAL